jgi:predicted phage terminase large subunit-like protein
MLENKEQYLKLLEKLGKLPEIEQRAMITHLCKTDLFFLCWFVLGQPYYFHDFAFNLCREVQENDERLFLVARGHLKSKTVTVAKSIQDILNNPDIAIGIVSYNLKTAKAFLREIMTVLESNEFLKKCFPNILYDNPKNQSEKWSEQEGIFVKRKTTRKEPTFYPFGLVDSQATGYHFDVLNFDDVVTQDSVTTPEMIKKTTDAWRMSDNLGMSGANCETKKRYCGTRYHYHDTYGIMLDEGVASLTIPATDNGRADGNPIYLTKEKLAKKLKDQGNYIFSCQNLLKPVKDDDKKFDVEKIVFYKPDEIFLSDNYYILVDSANSKSETSDFTTLCVVNYSIERKKFYLVDGFRKRLDLKERYEHLKYFVQKYKPIRVAYEKYGMMIDSDFIRIRSQEEGIFIPLMDVAGSMKKEDRILRLESIINYQDLVINENLPFGTELLMELADFPYSKHDDALDSLSRIFDVGIVGYNEQDAETNKLEQLYNSQRKDFDDDVANYIQNKLNSQDADWQDLD